MGKLKKTFPKIKKKLKDFLTDESGRITKKDALGLSAGAMLLAGVDNVAADSTGYRHTHSYNKTETPAIPPYPTNAETEVPAPSTRNASPNINTVSNQFIALDAGTVCSHASWIVNGHYSNIPAIDSAATVYTLTNTHTSHNSY